MKKLFLVICNLVLILFSVVITFLGISLLVFYRLDFFGFVSPWFEISPYLILSIACIVFLLSSFGCLAAVSHKDNFWHLRVFAGVMTLAFLLQLAGIFASMELRAVLVTMEYAGIDISRELNDYDTNAWKRYKWDTLQSEFQCCGGINYNNGYTIWRNTPFGMRTMSVPDSCCHNYEPQCGQNMFRNRPEEIITLIFTNGCLSVMETRFNQIVLPCIMTYVAIATFMALVQLLAVACAFSLTISKSRASSRHSNVGIGSLQNLRGSSMPGSSPPSRPASVIPPDYGGFPPSHQSGSQAIHSPYVVTPKYEQKMDRILFETSGHEQSI